MPSTNQASEMLPAMTWRNGQQGWQVGDRFVLRMAGGEDDPKPGEGDPPEGGAKGKDGQPFDATRAQTTIDTLRAEVKAGKATATELAAAKARLKEIEDKDKTEVERLAGSAKEASEKLTAAETRAQNLAIRLSVERAARKLNFIDEDDAYRLIDRLAVEMDADGDPINVEALLTALAKAKPHLVKADGTEAQKPAAKSGTPATPKPAGTTLTRDQDFDQRYGKVAASGGYPKFG